MSLLPLQQAPPSCPHSPLPFFHQLTPVTPPIHRNGSNQRRPYPQLWTSKSVLTAQGYGPTFPSWPTRNPQLFSLSHSFSVSFVSICSSFPPLFVAGPLDASCCLSIRTAWEHLASCMTLNAPISWWHPKFVSPAWIPFWDLRVTWTSTYLKSLPTDI